MKVRAPDIQNGEERVADQGSQRRSLQAKLIVLIARVVEGSNRFSGEVFLAWDSLGLMFLKASGAARVRDRAGGLPVLRI